MDVQEPCGGIFPPSFPKISQRNVEDQRNPPDESRESQNMDGLYNGCRSVGTFCDYNGNFVIGKLRRGRRSAWGKAHPRMSS